MRVWVEGNDRRTDAQELAIRFKRTGDIGRARAEVRPDARPQGSHGVQRDNRRMVYQGAGKVRLERLGDFFPLVECEARDGHNLLLSVMQDPLVGSPENH